MSQEKIVDYSHYRKPDAFVLISQFEDLVRRVAELEEKLEVRRGRPPKEKE
jgi:hypothetical protein